MSRLRNKKHLSVKMKDGKRPTSHHSQEKVHQKQVEVSKVVQVRKKAASQRKTRMFSSKMKDQCTAQC